jgi:Gpi18-like mannosyltransferase
MKNYRWALYVAVIFILIHPILNVWMWNVAQVFPSTTLEGLLNLYKGIAVETSPWLAPWQRWDTPQYQAIAERSYEACDAALFTPPLFPFLVEWTAPIFNGNTLISGLFISGMAFQAHLMAVYQTARVEFKDEKATLHSTLYTAFFPSALFLAAGYNESLFLLGAILSLYSARRTNWLTAGLWGERPTMNRLIPYLSWLGLLFFSAQSAIWGWVG